MLSGWVLLSFRGEQQAMRVCSQRSEAKLGAVAVSWPVRFTRGAVIAKREAKARNTCIQVPENDHWIQGINVVMGQRRERGQDWRIVWRRFYINSWKEKCETLKMVTSSPEKNEK